MPTDVEIAQAHTLEPITTIADRAGIPEQSLIPYGTTKAKIDITTTPTETTGKLVLVTGISPTTAGEGKSTVLIGLADAIRSAGRSTIVAIREPSLGPVKQELGMPLPRYLHLPLLMGDNGQKLSKQNGAPGIDDSGRINRSEAHV